MKKKEKNKYTELLDYLRDREGLYIHKKIDFFTDDQRDTLNRISKSITEKWIPIRDGKKGDEGGDNCPLCEKFYSKDYRGRRALYTLYCPIIEKTGAVECRETPYMKWRRHHLEEHRDVPFGEPMKVHCQKCKQLAQEEINFLYRVYIETLNKFLNKKKNMKDKQERKDKIRDILIELTDVIGYDHTQKHEDAFYKALKKLKELNK